MAIVISVFGGLGLGQEYSMYDRLKEELRGKVEEVYIREPIFSSTGLLSAIKGSPQPALKIPEEKKGALLDAFKKLKNDGLISNEAYDFLVKVINQSKGKGPIYVNINNYGFTVGEKNITEIQKSRV